MNDIESTVYDCVNEHLFTSFLVVLKLTISVRHV